MIDAKYGLKYSMPHSVVHIVDNSSYDGDLPVSIAEDPSLYSTIVLTGTPMGEDNRVLTITREDVINTAFGISSIGVNEKRKFGQSVEYPKNILKQEVPVRLMRVTPEGSTYGLSCILVQWRIDEDDQKMHVRLKSAEFPPELQLAKFQNTSRLNAALVKYFKNDTASADGYVWKQRVFINNISAGRGKAYNFMATTINPTSQGRNPANVRYEFSTIDTRINQVVETFNASLVNNNNSSRADYIETVNVAVSKRVEGSSIIVPYVNESAVTDVYNDYMEHYQYMLDTTVVDEFIRKAYIAMNINIFDLIYGNYIYDGTDTMVATKLPFYQVDMFDTSIPSLPVTNRVNTISETFDTSSPEILYTKITPLVYGVSRSGDNVYVGDVYLYPTGSNNANPMFTIVGAINQYTGSVTTLTIPKVHPLKNDEGTYTVDTTKSAQIKTIFNDTTNVSGIGSKLLNTMVVKNKLVVDDIVALIRNNTFTLFVVTEVLPNATGDKYTLSPAYTKQQVYEAIDWNSHSSGSVGVGNIIGRSTSDSAFTRVGATVINTEDASIWVNNYSYVYNESADFGIGRIAVENASFKFGTYPTDVNITTDLVGAEYDVVVYDTEDVTKWKVDSVIVADGGANYEVGDTVTFTTSEGTSNTILVVSAVDETGAVTALTISPNSTDETVVVVGSDITTTNIASSDGDGLKIDISINNVTPSDFEGNPEEIVRYMISGVQGSLFRIAQDPTEIPSNYYTDEYGINLTSEVGGVRIRYGSTGFFDDDTMGSVEFKWRYSALLVKGYRGELDARIKSTTAVPAKFIFDGGHNTIVGQTILPYVVYAPADIINASTIFTAEEKEDVMFDPSIIENITSFEDIDVKQAMYDLMEDRCFDGIPEDMRPIGPGSGCSLLLDSGITDANTAVVLNNSFKSRFTNPNASWDLGGYTDIDTGLTYTHAIDHVTSLFQHCRDNTVNKPFVGKATAIPKSRYSSYFPEIDKRDWDQRELLYNSGANVWLPDVNGNLIRKSQRTLATYSTTSDLIQESNMRTLSQFVYFLQNKIDDYLLEYDDDGVLKTLSDEVVAMFTKWIGTVVKDLSVTFEKNINIDGGEIVVCYANITFRGLILRVPIIVNVNRRTS